jgi:hypothetical protein
MSLKEKKLKESFLLIGCVVFINGSIFNYKDRFYLFIKTSEDLVISKNSNSKLSDRNKL